MPNNMKQTAINMANQVIGQLNQQPPQMVRQSPKPIFVIKVPLSIPPAEIDGIRKAITKDNIGDDYHVLIVGGNNDDYQFEMYNADKIERQEWNKLVNKIIK